MGVTLRGYVLEPPRVGGSNAAFTYTPNDLVSDPVAFAAHYPSGSEPVPRTEYLVLVQVGGLLAGAVRLGWTKNEVVARFDYAGQAQRFAPLPGGPLDVVGVVGPNLNASRLKVLAPVDILPEAPYRLSVGTASGTTLIASLVSSFGAPPVGTVEVLRGTGELNWNPADLVTYAGQDVRWQRQAFFGYSASTGRIGDVSSVLLLNPLPASGQYPLLRVGFGSWLAPVEKATEAGFDPAGVIPAGTFQWAANTGRVRLSAADASLYPGASVYHDGTLLVGSQPFPAQALGTVGAPGVAVGLPSRGGDLVFRLASGYQFPSVRRLDNAAPFDAGVAGEVQVRDNGQVQFSAADVATLGAEAVTLVYGDFPVERGVSLRCYRTPVNLDGGDPTVQDMTAEYDVQGATLADPIIAAPQVFLPAVPLDDATHPIAVTVAQGTGAYVGPLARLDVASPPAGLGYTLDFDNRQLSYAQRKVDQVVTLAQPAGAVTLPDPLINVSNAQVALETGVGTGVYTPLTLGTSALLDGPSGLVTFLDPKGTEKASGTGATAGLTLTDTSASFVATVQPGDAVFLGATVVNVVTVDSNSQLTLDANVGAQPSVSYIVRGAPEVLADRYWAPVDLVDTSLTVEKVTPLGVAQPLVVVGAYALAFPDPTTVTGGTFEADGVVPGDTLELTGGPDAGSYRVVVSVTDTALTVDRPFTAFVAAPGRVTRRLRVDPSVLPRLRVRLGATVQALVPVATDAAFAPAVGQVQVSQQTGNLAFNVADFGQPVAAVLGLVRGTDFTVTAALGFIGLTRRLLAREEVLVSYRTADATTGLPGPVQEERAGFSVAKELTTPTPRGVVTNEVFFNPTGRTVAPNPPPRVNRGGRPQTNAQVSVNVGASSVTFLPAVGFQTDALPSGSQVQPDERVYVDYSVYEAFGGEASFTVINRPIYVVSVTLTGGESSFVVQGDQTSVFIAGSLLRVDRTALYLLDSAVYDAGADSTTVTLAGGEVFADDVVSPLLEVSSGVVSPTYFVPEVAGWPAVPRGSASFVVQGDQTSAYKAGTVLYWATGPHLDFYEVSGSVFEETGATRVTLTQKTVRQVARAGSTLRRALRPIVSQGQTRFQASAPPAVAQGYTVVRRVGLAPGVVVTATLDDAGFVEVPALTYGESLLLFYTAYKVAAAGVRVKATYTCGIVPTSGNGLLGQVLRMDYTLFSPDTFFYRVETLTNFQGEVAADLEEAALASAPTAGPTTSNAASPRLYEQGRPSLFFTEGHLANVDYVARVLLKFFNDIANRLEDLREDAYGVVVGEADGRFRFDGLTDNPPRTAYSQVTNDIDDTYQVSPFPVVVTWNPPAAPVYTYQGTNVPLWQPSVLSRLYPTMKRTLYGVTTAGADTGATTGQPVEDLGQTNLTTAPPTAYRRWPRGQVVTPAEAGSTVLFLDNARGTADLLRPAFAPGMKVIVVDADGTVLVSDAAPLTVGAALGGPERITVSALPVPCPAGATVYLCTTGATPDTTYQKSYRLGTDLNLDGAAGYLTYVKPYFPFDGSVPLIPAELNIQAPNSGEFLQVDGALLTSTATTPFRFPALDGQALTDSGDQGLPIQSPTYAQETYLLGVEAAGLATALADTTAPVTLGPVTLDGAGTGLSLGVAWPAPTPQLYDLVRFTSGPNAAAGWRRVNAVFPTSLTVDTAFPTPGIGGTIEVTATVNVATGTATFPSATILDDAALSPVPQPGHTVVFTSGLNLRLRRQVVARLSATQLLLDAPVPNLVLTTYRVSNHLNTYSNLPQAEAQAEVGLLLTHDHHVLPGTTDAEVIALGRFLDGDVLDSASGVLTDTVAAPVAGIVAGTLLTAAGEDFVAAGVLPGGAVYVDVGVNRGWYPVAVVVGPTQLQTTVAFPVAGAVSCRVVSVFGVSSDTVSEVVGQRFQAQDAAAGVQVWLSSIPGAAVSTTPPDLAVYVNGVTLAGVVARQVAVAARQGALSNGVTGAGAVAQRALVTKDKLYDKRFAWIGARVNVQDGTLYQVSRAVAQRQTAQQQLVGQLYQLLAMRGLA